MRIIICKQNLYGGTDKLLERLAMWLIEQRYDVEILGDINTIKANKFELAIIPSSQMGDLWRLKKRGIEVERVLVWILGMGAFYESYYNEAQNVGLKKIPIKFLQKEASATLAWLYEHNSIIYTDEVGAYNTYRKEKWDYKQNLDDNLVPIAIEIKKLEESKIREKAAEINMAWVGRVSNDFKSIPLQQLIDDINEWTLYNEQKIQLTIVGTGDAVEKIRKKCAEVRFPVQFIEEIDYEKLGDFISKHVDLLVAMGTSALDGAKVGCPTMVITPVREYDPQNVYYRWIYESKGYSLGEFPGIDIETNQIRKSFSEMLSEYIGKEDQSEKSYEYAKNFEINNVFNKLINRKEPERIDQKMWRHIKFFYNLKKLKNNLKRIIVRE